VAVVQAELAAARVVLAARRVVLLVVQAVLPRPDHTLVLQGECHWKQRAFWEDPLLQLVNSLQVGGAP